MSGTKLIYFGITLVAFSIVTLTMGSAAMAATDEIVVTAKGREQSLSDVPLSITVVDETRIEAGYPDPRRPRQMGSVA